VGSIPRDRRHLDADVGELLHERIGDDPEILALGAHRPHRDVAFGRGWPGRLRGFPANCVADDADARRGECEHGDNAD